MKHPWWHWFFTHVVEHRTTTCLAPGSEPEHDTLYKCTKCKKKWRVYHDANYEFVAPRATRSE